MKKVYNSPALRYIDLEAEQMIATSVDDGTTQTLNQDDSTDEQWTQKQEPNFWGREGIWK